MKKFIVLRDKISFVLSTNNIWAWDTWPSPIREHEAATQPACTWKLVWHNFNTISKQKYPHISNVMATLFFILSFCFLIYFLFCKVGFLKHLGVQYTTICILNRLVLPLPTLCMLNTCYYVKVMTWDMMVLALMAFCLKNKIKKAWDIQLVIH